MRVGIGYDIHAFAAGRRLVLGGVEIPAERGLAGHSDADVLLHAVMDALLGAAGLLDIGHYFPNTDPRFKNCSSLVLLRAVAQLLNEQRVVIGNIDATILAEQPKLSAHITAMKSAIAEALAIAPQQIGIKATTNELLGALGRGEGIAAMAVACVNHKE